MSRLRPYQQSLKAGVFAEWQAGHRNVLAKSPTGSGKCLAKGTPVLMYDGTVKPVEDVRVGDLLIGPDSKARTVLSLANGQEMMYAVTPVKGDTYVVNESHILSLRMTNGSDKSCGIPNGTIVNISVVDYLKKNKTFKHCAKGWRTPIDFAEISGPKSLDPYMLGLWLGDGNSKGFSITCGDIETVISIQNFATCENLSIRYEANSENSMMLHVVERLGKNGWSGRRGARPNGFLREQNLLHNKHVPLAYKTASRAHRLELLAGLIDSDGHAGNGVFDLTLKNETLFDDIVFVARSLGFACYKKPVVKICTNNGVFGNYFRCSISGDVSQIPCRIERKKIKTRKQIKNVTNVGIEVKPVGKGEYFGFELDGDRLFVLGDFTVTHNTVLFSDVVNTVDRAAAVIAHRSELVGQTSMALAREGVRHRIIGPDSLRRNCVTQHMEELGRSFYDAGARVGACGVDTLVNKDISQDSWFRQVGLWVQDEAHHVLKENKWGRAAEMFPNALGLGVTATPARADGKGLGRHADGLFDAMVEGPEMRELIGMGYMTDYKVFAPPSDIDYSHVPITDSGDFSPAKLRAAVHASDAIVGDVVRHYKTVCMEKLGRLGLGVTFAVDVEAAQEIAAAYKASGVPAEVVTAKTPDMLRTRILRSFKKREILQLVNVDLFGEGFDLPAIEVVSMVRKTESWPLFVQQFGRALRLMIEPNIAANWDAYSVADRLALIAQSLKPFALIIDHVGNVIRHGLPDAARKDSLDGRLKRSSGPSDAIPARVCANTNVGGTGEVCAKTYERIHHACPFCGFAPEPVARTAPEFVDGDLFELDDATLAAMRGKVVDTLSSVVYLPAGVAPVSVVAQAIRNRHGERQQAQIVLRDLMALWGGWQTAQGYDERQQQRLFWHTFGVDVLGAQALGRPEAEALGLKIKAVLDNHGVISL